MYCAGVVHGGKLGAEPRQGNPRVRNAKNENARSKAGAYDSIQGSPSLAVLGGAPGEARDVRAADADIGKLAVAEAGQFAQAAVVVLPGLDEADDGGKHGILFLSMTRLGRFTPSPVNRINQKIGRFRRLKRNYVALQLGGKRIA
jgi:hypothetical protein